MTLVTAYQGYAWGLYRGHGLQGSGEIWVVGRSGEMVSM